MVNKEEFKEKYRGLFEDYVAAKPLLNEVYKRNGNEQTEAILNEIRAINDHVARFFDDNRGPDDKYDELTKAEGHLKRMIYDAYKQLNIFFFDSMNDFEEKNFGIHWLHVNKGKFWIEYKQKRDSITKIVKEAKIQEGISSEAAFKCYEQAYIEQRDLYKLIDDNHDELVLSKSRKMLNVLNSQKGWLISTIILAVVPALLWELGKHFSQIITWLATSCSSLFYAFCEWGLGLYK